MRLTPDLGSDIAHVEPFPNTRGGFFACLATTHGGSRFFAKCILSRGREAQFWRVWRAGGIRTEGAFYRLLPPDYVVRGSLTTVLVFPMHPALPLTRKRRIRGYSKHAGTAVRALADFNSDHMGPALSNAFPDSGRADAPRVPRLRMLETTYGFDRDTARAATDDLRTARNAWPGLTEPLDGSPRCLCHLDLGRGNVIFEKGKATMLDFGHAAIAPAGADLHTLQRYTRPDASERKRFAELYSAEFDRKGVALDPDLVRLAIETRFASRYSDPRLPSARPPNVFLDALETLNALTGRARPV